jgi:hypothetical protein
MDPLGCPTPYRNSALLLDVELASVLQESGIALHRRGAQIARRAAQGTASKNTWQHCRYWQSGCWSIEPLQHDMANLHESTAAASLVISLWNWIQTLGAGGNQDIMQTVYNWTKSTVTGASYSGSVPLSGDSFFRKRVPSLGSFDPAALPANAGFDSARPAMAYPNADIPMDRTGYSGDTFPHDAGFFLRWRVPGHGMAPHRYLLGFHFGQYCLVLTGSGEAQLWEYALHAGESGTHYWTQRDAWRFTQETNASAGHAHCMAIYPKIASDGNRYIDFSNLSKGAGPKANAGKKVDTSHAVTGEHSYRISSAVMGTDVDQSPGHATTANLIRLDVRRDSRIDIQVSRLGWPTDVTASLYDDPVLVPAGNFVGNTSTINQNYGFITPVGTVCAGEILDAVTGVTFVSGTDKYPRAHFTLTTTDTTVTPTLWAFHHVQQAAHIAVAPGEFAPDLREVNIQGYSGDPQTEIATVEAVDEGMAHTRLTKRGRFSAKIVVQFAPDLAHPGTTKTVTLFHGVARAPQWEQVGADLAHPGGTGPGPGTLPTGKYIAPHWNRYSITIAGMWDRLAEKVQPPYPEIFAVDPTAPTTGAGWEQTWKVTDAIKKVLHDCGFDASFQNIPDLPVRLWPGSTESSSELTIEPTTSLAEWLVRMIREHLGAYLHFEPNAGANGQWILIFGTQPTGGTFASPLYNFTRSQGSSTGLRNPMAQGSFAAVGGVPTTFCQHVRGTQNAPNFNKVTVIAGIPATDADTQQVVKQVAVNPLSYTVPGATVSADPDHPDYIGHCVEFELIAPQLTIAADGTSDITNSQGTVDWLTRRYYDFYCHGQKLLFIDAPLVFVQDTSLSATVTSSSGNWRPLRFQDPVMFEGDASWLVKAIRPYWTSDRVQMCSYELIAPMPGQHFIGHDGQEVIKRAHRASIAKNSGMPHSAIHSGRTVPAHKHSQYHKLSQAGTISTVQNADGSFIPMAGWNTWDGSSG